jgi:tRNA(Ile)-lysidine synthase
MIEAASVDHGLRAASADEAKMVGQLCADLDIPHHILPIQVPAGNVQSMARGARYQALAKWMEGRELSILATAHHADDQAETLLMRLNRGSGLAGLAGVRRDALVPDTKLRLIRPLLHWRKSELEAVVRDAGIAPALDPSNLDDAFDRVRIRKAIEGADWLDPAALSSSASHLADALEVLAWAGQREWNDNVKHEGDQIFYTPSAPRAVVLTIVARAIAQLGNEPRGGVVAQLVTALEGGQGGNLSGVLAKCVTGDDGVAQWVFQPEPPRQR